MFANEETLVTQLNKAAATDDAALFYDTLTIDAPTTQQQAYKAYVTESSIVQNATQSILIALNVLKNSERTVVTTAISEASADEFTIEKEKKFGLFEHYTISPIPFDVVATTNIEDVAIELEEQTTSISTETPVGSYLLGEYEYDVVWENELGSLRETRTLQVTPTSGNVLEGNLALYAVGVPGAVYDDFTYYVNGKELNREKHVDGNVLRIPEGVTITLSAAFTEDGVRYESDPVELNSTFDMELAFPAYDEKLLAAQQQQQVATAAREAAEKEAANQQAAEHAAAAMNEQQIAALIDHYLAVYSAQNVAALPSVVHTSTAFYTEQTKYIQSLMNRGMQSSVTNYTITNIRTHTDDHFTVTVNEQYAISKPNEATKSVNQTSTYTVKRMDGNLYITALQL